MSSVPTLIDPNKFIEENKLKEVTSSQIFTGDGKFHPDGVYSETIFGKYGTKKRDETFAYINLGAKYILPDAFDFIKLFVSNISSVLAGKLYVAINDTGVVVTVDEKSKDKYSIVGTGVEGIVKVVYENFDKINGDVYAVKDAKVYEFVKNNLDKIFIDKLIVLPAGLRDIKKINNQYQETEISKLYRHLINLVKSRQSGEYELLGSGSNIEIDNRIQTTLDKIVREFTNLLRSKTGIVRGARLSKRVDHVARLVLGHNANLKANEVSVPWFVLLKLYEPFIIYHILRDDKFSDVADFIKKQQTDGSISVNAVRSFLTNVANNPTNIPKEVKERLIEILEIVLSGKHDGVEKRLIVLRHPVESRDSILGLKPVINKDDVYSAQLPQVLFSTLGADCDGDQVVIYALHTKQANEEAKVLDPIYGAAKYNIDHYGSIKVDPSMDMALGVWMVTRDPNS